MYKNGGGINIDKMSETEGDFRNGLEVSIRMIMSSTSTWGEAIRHLCLFDKLHITYQGESYFLKGLVSQFNERKITNFNSFSRCSLLPHKNYFKVGNVLYDVEADIDLKTSDGLIINLPIGSVDITPNREALQYTDYTNRTINQKVAETKKELQGMANAYIKGDISMSKFYRCFCEGSKVTVEVNEESFSVDREDIELDISSVTIGGKHIPVDFIKFINTVKLIGIDKSIIYRTINKSMYSRRSVNTSIKHLLLGDYVLVNKLDRVTKQVTWLYFTEHATHTSVILTYGCLESFKDYIEKFVFKTFAPCKMSSCKEWVDFLFKNVKIDTMSNSDVPSSVVEAYMQVQRDKRRRKKIDAAKIPIRQYQSRGYNRAYLDDIPKHGLIIYGSHTYNDQTLIELAALFYPHTGIGGVITIKAGHLPLLANNRRFVSVDSFLFLRNKVLSRLVTAKIICDKFNDMFRMYKTKSINFLIWKEFLKKYSNEQSCIESGYLHSDTFSSITDYYIKKGWVNQYDIQYFSLSEEEMHAASVWDRMHDYRTEFIQMAALQKFGRMPKIGLVPVKIPKLTYIKEKTDESI